MSEIIFSTRVMERLGYVFQNKLPGATLYDTYELE